MKKEIDILELFSGIGGFSKGFIEAGYTIKRHQFSEIDKHAIANYKYNFKNAESIGSVTNVRGLETPDVLTFGSPCQDFSLAGKRMGMGGQRSSLVTEAIRLIDELRPPVFIWENVKGTFSSNNGEDFWAIIKAFTNIGGYRLEWQLLNTSWFLPQNRERIYLIGHLDGRSRPGVFPISETDKLCNKPNEIGEEIHTNNRNALTQQARQYSSWCGDFIRVKALTETRTEESKKIRKESREKGRDFSPRRGKELTFRKDSNHNTITSTQGFEQLTYINGSIRQLTEIECERLQGFPDNWTKYGLFEERPKRKDLLFREQNPELWAYHTKQVNAPDVVLREISKTQRYKMCGNAVTVAVVKAIAERLCLKP